MIDNWQYKIRAVYPIHSLVCMGEVCRRLADFVCIVAVSTAVYAVYSFIGGSQKCARPPGLRIPKPTH